MAQGKERADELVFVQGLAESREMAKRLIMAGKVAMDDGSGVLRKVDKPGHKLPPDTVFSLVGIERYVSRGAYKLLTAIEHFKLDVTGFVCLDAGASTGGFTDCMLQAGAAHVWSIDVGHDQLHESLVADERVTSLEGLDIRLATPELLGAEADFLGSDVSFISLGKVLPSLAGLIHTGAHAVCLVKPQFEAGPEHVGKRGVVKDPQVHRDVLACVTEQARQAGFAVLDLTHSPIKGPEGNIEYLMFLQKDAGDEGRANADLITRVVREAHAELND